MRYFPLDGSPYAMTLGVRPLHGVPRLDFDAAQLQLKQKLLAAHPHFHFQALPGTEPLQQQAAHELGLRNAPEPNALDWAGRQLAEDLILLADSPGWPLVAGQLCFPNDWCLAEKLGSSLFAVHSPVPGFASRVGDSTLKLFDKLKPEAPVWRANWAVKVTDRLDLPPAVNATFEPLKREITAANAGHRCFFRIERQTLSRLPSGILFTVRTYVEPLQNLSVEERAALRAALRTAPPDLLAYKGLQPFLSPLLDYLAHSIQ